MCYGLTLIWHKEIVARWAVLAWESDIDIGNHAKSYDLLFFHAFSILVYAMRARFTCFTAAI